MFSLRAGLLMPSEEGLKYLPDAYLQINGDGVIQKCLDDASDQVNVGNSGKIILPGASNTHCHTFQPPAVSGELISRNEGGEFVGWLPETLKFETRVKENPELAREIAVKKLRMYINNGITSSLEYTTSSEEAARIVLEVAEEIGLLGVRVGLVAMNQGIDFINGVKLEMNGDELIAATERLISDFGKRIAVIDRFPIAVTSPLRRRLADLARKNGLLFETHVDESHGEAEIHANSYGGARIMETLFEDGVFAPGSKVGLAHAIHTNDEDFARLEKLIQNGDLELNIRACPNSNAQLQSHRLPDGRYVPFPLREWKSVGANVTFGLDKGAGRGRNIFAEALCERGRLHTEGFVPSYLDLLEMATVNGSRSLGLNPEIVKGSKANLIIVNPSGMGSFYNSLPTDAEVAAGMVIEGAQDSSNIEGVFVDGKRLK